MRYPQEFYNTIKKRQREAAEARARNRAGSSTSQTALQNEGARDLCLPVAPDQYERLRKAIAGEES